ncbi:DUF3426 domain-containing protein [Undibacterium sp. TJN19]|uniref:DUF3426 domain-containing protein n=1 Tax=Undibacterium sp. TJN19 TaxID=3413055 RepID=UPI003BF182F4
MALATRCPHCHTAFKVANDQLKLHAGVVRCGACQQTFNGVEHLIADGQQAAISPAAVIARATAPANSAPLAATPAAQASPADNTIVTPQKTAAVDSFTTTAPAITPAVAAEKSPVATPVAKPEIPATPKPPETPATTKPASKPVAEAMPAPATVTPAAATATPKRTEAASLPAADVLAAITRAENEIEAENANRPKPAASATPVAPATPALSATPAKAPVPATPDPVTPPVAAPGAVEIPAAKPVMPAAPVTSSALDFDLGDGSFGVAAEETEINEADLSRVELETRAALMDPPTADWSVSEGKENTEPVADSLAPITATKVWRHKENTEPASEHAADDLHKPEPYIGAEEAALANQAAVSEDSSSDVVSDEEDSEYTIQRPGFVIEAEKKQKRRRIANIMLGLMLLLLLPLLLAQSAYIFRSQLAAWMPDSKPYLVQACKLLQCQVNLPAQIEKITVESNELQTLAPDRNVFMLVMQIQNHSDIVQAWPNVELVLNDAKDKAVLQRAFTPADYLAEKDKITKGFAPNSDQNIKLYFELPKLKAAGYHVGVFYP